MTNPVYSYSDEYKQQVKMQWYAAGKPVSGNSIRNVISPDSQNKKPSAHTLENWKKDYMWDMWADEMDSRALAKVEDSLVLQKAEMLERHARDAATIQAKAIEYLEDIGFDSSSSAVSAIIRGAELERTSRGIGDLIIRMAKMDDGALAEEITRLIARADSNNQIIDVDSIDEEEETTTEE